MVSACCGSLVFVQECEGGAYYVCEDCLRPATLKSMPLEMELPNDIGHSRETASLACQT